jgi:hypothetical protein
MLFEIQRACPRPGQSRVIASGPSAIKTLERLTTLLPNAKVSVETLTIPEIEPEEDFQVKLNEIPNDPSQHVVRYTDDDDITLAQLKENLEDNMTLAEIKKRIEKEMRSSNRKTAKIKKNLEEIRLVCENVDVMKEHDITEKNDDESRPRAPKWEGDEMTFYSNMSGHLPNF